MRDQMSEEMSGMKEEARKHFEELGLDLSGRLIYHIHKLPYKGVYLQEKQQYANRGYIKINKITIYI